MELEKGFEAVCVTHPATYVNKILIGGEDGTFQLWNFRKRKRIYTFSGWSSGITCLESTPALDVVAIGLKNGFPFKIRFILLRNRNVVLHNLKLDVVIHIFQNIQSSCLCCCTSLSFTTGSTLPLLASGWTNGEIIVYDLREKEVFCIQRQAHASKVVKLQDFISLERYLALFRLLYIFSLRQ